MTSKHITGGVDTPTADHQISMRTRLAILILETAPFETEKLLSHLRQGRFDVSWHRVETRKDYLSHLHEGWDAIVAQYNLSGFNATEALALLRDRGLDIPMIIISDNTSETLEVECLDRGAADYLLENRLARLPKAVERALAAKKLRQEKQQAQAQLELHDRDSEDRAKERVAELLRVNEQLQREISQRGRAEAALRKNEEQLRTLITKNADGIVVVDRQGIVRFVNPAAESLFGRKAEALVGEVLGFPVGGSDKTEVDVRSATGEAAIAQMRVVEIDWESVPAYLISLRDVTETKQLERELKQRTADLEVANQELEAFSYSVSHDLRGPLNGIKGFSDLLARRCSDRLDDRGKQYLQSVRNSCTQMNELIDDLLQLSRASRSEIDLQPVDLSVVAKTIALKLKQTEPQREVEFVIAPDTIAKGDPKLLRIVLENLLGNAWKYTSKRDRSYIEFGMDTGSKLMAPSDRQLTPSNPQFALEKCVYFVRDNGAGFDPNSADELFVPFRRLHSHHEFEGTGIGLATVKRIIHHHGGRIWAAGSVGVGATFYFTLGDREILNSPTRDR